MPNREPSHAWIYELYRLGASRGPLDDPRAVYTDMLRHVTREMLAQSGSLAIRDEERGDCVIVAVTGMPERFLGTRIASGVGVLGRVAYQGEALLLNGSVEKDARFQAVNDRKDSGTPGSALCWPLTLEGNIIGALSINRPAGETPFGEDDLERGAVMLNLVSVALENLNLRLDQELRIADLTEAKRRLEEAQHQLLQADKMASIGQLAAGVAHEINNPVGYVSSNLGTLQRNVADLLALIAAYEGHEAALDAAARADLAALKGRLDIDFLREDVVALIEESLSGLTRVKKIVQDLKDFSHVDESEWQWADLHKGLDSTLNIVWNEIKYKAELAKEYGELPEVECQPFQLNQVFMNLLMNAAQAIEEKGVITLRSGRGEGETVWVEVADNGKGIPAENLKRIFDPFFTTKSVGKGTGLGLSLSYSIVQKHNGQIEVYSEVGQGTRFRVSLPIKHAEDKA